LSTSPITPNGTIAVSSAIAIDLGQTAVVGENGQLTAIARHAFGDLTQQCVVSAMDERHCAAKR